MNASPSRLSPGLRVPAEAIQVPTVPTVPAAPPHPAVRGPASILLVDDDERNLTALESILASPAHRLVRAQSPDDALLVLIDGDFAVIVLDICMPGMTGIELAQLIKQRRKCQHIPIIFLTAYLQDEKDVLEGYVAGAVDYLRKPLDPVILRSKVGVFVDLFLATRALAAANSALECEVMQRQRAEAALLQINADLESRVRERTADLVAANRKLRASEERYRLILENALEYAIFSVDLEGCVATWNTGAQRVTGFAADEIIGRPLDLLFTREDRDAGILARTLDRALRFGRTEDERWHVRSDGSLFWASGMLVILKDEDDRHVGFLKILRDRTSRKREEEALTDAKAEAEAASRAKDDFLAVLSHELRTPLMPAIMLADERAQDPALAEDVRNDFAAIQTGIELEVRLIDDLLDLTRIARGKLILECRPVDLHAVLSASWDLLKFEAADKNLVVDFDLSAPQPWVTGDPVRLHQVFWNLVKNAVKFTPANGHILIRTRGAPPVGVAVEIADNGVGIDPQDLERVFLPFDQGARKGNSGGLGLGLTISRRLVEVHGGVIHASSEGRGCGTTIRVELPLGMAAAPSGAGPSRPQMRLEPLPIRRILLIEDHPQTGAALELLLARRGYEVRWAGSLAEARRCAAAFSFDLVLSDLGLPDGSGHEIMPELRRLRPNCLGIAISGYGMEADVRRSLAAGFSLHLTKPVTVRALELALERAMKATSEAPPAMRAKNGL